MKYIVEVHNRPKIEGYSGPRSEPDFDYWFMIEKEDADKTEELMQKRALEIVNKKFEGIYSIEDLAVIDRTAYKDQISPKGLEELEAGKVTIYEFWVWNGWEFVERRGIQ